ncbi:MAG TPA: right-handed parallel beta-helix repeat-containing protein [Actinomycetota bacterium]|nr:right-handed parallel beta-helix repeat-containing protein [Actinomycetota bacterium]
MGLARVGGAIGLATAFVLTVAPPAHAATIEVFPGPNAIQNAVTSAAAGDTLLIHAGTYAEHVTVGSGKSNLTLRAFGDGPVYVDARCQAFTAVDVNAGSVTIDGMRIRGGTYYETDFTGVAGGAVTRSVLRDTCDALYGVNVFNTTGTMFVSGNAAAGFGDAAIYVGGIVTSTAAVTVAGNHVAGNNRGIIVEDIAAAADVSVDGNTTSRNRMPGESATTAGIFLRNADGVLVDRNVVRNNGGRGIELDANSTGNVVTANMISGHTYDLSNLGTNNCFSANAYTTSTGPLPSCP